MCGVIGIVSFVGDDVLDTIINKLIHIQNRGRNSTGLAIINSRQPGSVAYHRKKPMAATKWLTDLHEIGHLKEGVGAGDVGIGHVQYSTAAKRIQRNAQPLYDDDGGHNLLLASNGDIPMLDEWREWLKRNRGCVFGSNCDAEVIVKYIGSAMRIDKLNEADAFAKMMRELPAAYSLVAITPSKRLFAARDKFGFRPLFWVKTDTHALVCSESALLAQYGKVQELKPGSLLIISPDGSVQEIPVCAPDRHECLMERFYFSRPDSRHNTGQLVDTIRRQLGKQIAKRIIELGWPMPDLVSSVPFSGGPSAEGASIGFYEYAHRFVPMITVVLKDRFSERIFQGDSMSRLEMIERRFTVNPDEVLDKWVLVSDDSIVRGDQGREIVRQLWEAGAAGVIYAVTAPAHRHACYMGINTPDEDRLIAHNKTDDEVRAELGADYLLYLDLPAIFGVMGSTEFCTACFTGDYPLPVPAGRAEV